MHVTDDYLLIKWHKVQGICYNVDGPFLVKETRYKRSDPARFHLSDYAEQVNAQKQTD